MKSKGFTLLEVVMALGLMALVVACLFGLPALFSKQQNTMVSIVTQDRIFKSFAQNFIDVAAQADVAVRFEYLPINAACTAGNPCIQQMTNGVFGPAALPMTSLQYFNDESGTLVPSFLNNQGDPTATTSGWFAWSRPHVSLPSTITGGEYYATWPLVSASSPPFPLLKRSSTVNAFFSIVPAFASSGSISNSDWVIVAGSRPGLAVKGLVDHPMVVYNSNDFTQYMIRKVAAALDCTTKDHTIQSQCEAAAHSLLGSSFPSNQPPMPSGPNDPFFTSDNYYAFELQPYSAADLTGFLPGGVATPSAWNGQAASIFLFPTNQLSIGWVGGNNPDALDFANPTVSNMAHVYHGWPTAQQGNLMFLPVDLQRYYLVNQAGGLMSLNVQTLGVANPVDVLDQIQPGSQIQFVRKLGTTEFGVFEMQ